MNDILAEAERLHKLGFAIHWLRPESKIPLNGGWTKGDRLSFAELKKTYKKGLNIGVRLGAVSEVDGATLAVVDVDVKGDKPRHAKEAERALFELFPETEGGPSVISGRGNGSSHYYVRLKEAVSGADTKAQSKEEVRVLMPSVPPNKREQEVLPWEALEEGYRLRPAWEISLLSEGRQTVLAGSIHPDTKAKYAWKRPIASGADIPLLKATPKGQKANSTKPEPRAPGRQFELTTVDVDTLPLKRSQIAAIKDGEGVGDRSAKIYELTLAMLARGISPSTIVSVFTDKGYYLGGVSYEHAKTKQRQLAARWVDRYCLSKAEAKLGESDFDHEELPNDEEAKGTRREKDRERYKKGKAGAPARAVLWPKGFSDPPAPWQLELDLAFKGRGEAPIIKANYTNLRLILANCTDKSSFVAYDEFAQRAYYTAKTPWGSVPGDQRSAGNEDALRLKAWLHEFYGVTASQSLVNEALDTMVILAGFHPLREYLSGLQWDGVPRIASALKVYMGARMPEPYLSEISKKFFIGAVARAFRPGIKFDYMVVLEGNQGIGKSSFAEALAGERWFLDGLPDFKDKDAALNLVGTWLCELSELASLNSSDRATAKAFFTRKVDRIRPPYGARRVDYPRSTIFLGTTNERDYLNDPTGNRRYWPCAVTQCDFEAVARDRDQLWAEAVFRFEFEEEKLFLTGHAAAQAIELQELRRAEDEQDAMQFDLKAWEAEQDEEELKRPKELSDLFNGPFISYAKTRTNMMRAAGVLRRNGYEKQRFKTNTKWLRH